MRNHLILAILLLSAAPTASAIPPADAQAAYIYATDVAWYYVDAAAAIYLHVGLNVTNATVFEGLFTAIDVYDHARIVYLDVGSRYLASFDCVAFSDQPVDCLGAEAQRAPELVAVVATFEEASAAEADEYVAHARPEVERTPAFVIEHTTSATDAAIARTFDYLALP